MIDELKLEYFKCFKKLKLSLAPLTILTGLNSAGKSSVIQSIVLPYQTLLNFPVSELITNGEYVQLGTADELVDKVYGQDRFTIVLNKGNEDITFQINLREDINKLEVSISSQKVKAWDKKVYSFFHKLQYIAADRQGPSEIHTVQWFSKDNSVGSRGEKSLWYILNHDDYEVTEGLQIKDTPPQLLRQVEAWMAKFFPGSRFEIQPVERTNLASFGLRTSDATGFHRPQNVGFGYSYTLPIVTACLGAEKEDIIIIENPEAHLHPGGQSFMGEFLSLVSATGVQIIVETHSDHIINGMRKAVKKQNIPPDEVKIYFFRHRKDDQNAILDEKTDLKYPQVFSPVINAKGKIDKWPSGFFDQYDNDVEELVEW